MKKAWLLGALAFVLSGTVALEATTAGERPKTGTAPKGGQVELAQKSGAASATCSIYCNDGTRAEIDGNIDFYGCWAACELICGGPCTPLN